MNAKPSLVKPMQMTFVSKVWEIPSVRELFDEKYAKLEYTELLRECHNIEMCIPDEQINIIKKEPITQAKGSAVFQHTPGRIRASNCHAACLTDPA